MLIHKGTNINLLDHNGSLQNLSCDLDKDRELQEGEAFLWYGNELFKVVKIHHSTAIDCIDISDYPCEGCEFHINNQCSLEDGCQTEMWEQFSLRQ